MEATQKAAAQIGILAACTIFDIPRVSYYRWLRPVHGPWPKPASPRALSEVERKEVLSTLHTSEFVDKAPAEVYATLLDQERYLCSPRTMYRVLAANDEVRERRNQLRHPSYAAPELLATKPNELWSWDITKLKGPEKWNYFHLYVILDVFSRYVVGWMVADRESSALAIKLIEETCQRQGITRDQLTLHADRGSSMKSKPVALLLADLGVTKTHSRPRVSDDNPFSESQFKTLKYRPDFPKRFGSLEDARSFMADFFRWYNDAHHHSGIAMMTPYDVHHGLAASRRAQRSQVLDAAYRTHPERFVHGQPKAAEPPKAVWINKPKEVKDAPGPEPESTTCVAFASSANPGRPSNHGGGPAQAELRKSDTPKVSRAEEPIDGGMAYLRPAGDAAKEVMALH